MLSEEDRKEAIASLTPAEAEQAIYDWSFWARDKQLPPPGDWLTWLVKAGRGFGKTRTGAEWVRDRVEREISGRLAFVHVTPADVRDVMIEGESGILAISPPDNRPLYEPSKRRLTWPNGAIATAFSSYEPDKLRGPQHDGAWCEEVSSWKYAQDTWDNLMFGLRLGEAPQICVTTTPKPIQLLRDLIADPTTVITSGSSYENRANLTGIFFNTVIKRYEGTSLGRQEIHAELLEESEGALWKRQWLNDGRIGQAPDLVRIVVAIDPAATSNETSDETGIIAAGVDAEGNGYVLKDRSGRYTPDGWAKAAIALFDEVQADRIIGETNNGGEMVEFTLRTIQRSVSYKAVHASRGKQARAEPIVALYEQGKMHHVGMFPDLEDQLCNWEPNSGDRSPDRLDALVWAFTELTQGGRGNLRFIP